MKEEECYLFIFVGYSFLLFMAGLIPGLEFNDENQFDIEALNWSQSMFSDIQIVKPNEMCSNGFQNIIEYNWAGLKDGCYCEDKQLYQKQKCNQQMKKQSCQLLPPVYSKVLSNYYFSKSSLDSDTQLSFKMCGKVVKAIKQWKKQSPISEFCKGGGEIRCYLENIAFCIEGFENCPIPQSYCTRQEKSCTFKQITICIPRNNKCPKQMECDNNQKACFVKDSILCIDEDFKCPITNISFNYEGQQPPRQFQDIEEMLISFNSGYKLYVDRNKRGIPIVDFTISSIEGVCFGDKTKIIKKHYPLDNRNLCQKEDDRYLPILQYSTLSINIYKVNGVNLDNHSAFIPTTDQFDLYFRRFYDFQYECQYQIDRDSLKQQFSSLVSCSYYLYYISFLGLIFILIGVIQILNGNKFSLVIFCICIFMALINSVIFGYFEEQSDQITKALTKYENEECYDNSLINDIYELKRFINGSAILFVEIIYFPIIIYIKIVSGLY